jgi:hypothetical protein
MKAVIANAFRFGRLTHPITTTDHREESRKALQWPKKYAMSAKQPVDFRDLSAFFIHKWHRTTRTGFKMTM